MGYFDTETLETKQTEMLVEGKEVLVKDTSDKGLWKALFTLNEKGF